MSDINFKFTHTNCLVCFIPRCYKEYDNMIQNEQKRKYQKKAIINIIRSDAEWMKKS